MDIRNRANERTAAHIPRAIGCRGTNATPGIAIQLDELEYLLSGLYPGVVLAIEGELPFQGFEERLHGHGGVVVRAAFAGERLDEPAILELPANLLEVYWLPLSV